ncbi:phosphoribosylanthranilate isomerase [Halospina denitrificans]|uniref:N-(5'-phosphoribosyl)anthranilate isomerase n=1 Tax=Halospina denitrificans TaxID=332522 RepID=A0A4R7JTD0_9GAMM|nr:phosphoribosylanthranilate isomerase [Halospina denitrificans]TDT41540.1 phosphoribosylanthranilate isomerase [Halospina denitrificans]
MDRTRVKICGITRPEDALAAAQAGADAIGLVFYPASARAVTIPQASAICHVLPPFVTVVGLMVNPEAEMVRKHLEALPLDLLQFHGDESAGFCNSFGHPWIKAVRVRDAGVVAQAEEAYHGASGILADAYDPDQYGGTGRTFNWGWLPERPSRPLILAGGLNAGNVGDAVRRVRPWAVDVSGGVEDAPGIKNAALIQNFIREVIQNHETD